MSRGEKKSYLQTPRRRYYCIIIIISIPESVNYVIYYVTRIGYRLYRYTVDIYTYIYYVGMYYYVHAL